MKSLAIAIPFLFILAGPVFAADPPQLVAEYRITTDTADQQAPDIHQNIVVWTDGRGADLDIYAADVTDPAGPVEFPVVTDAADQIAPAVSGNFVVWEDYYYAVQPDQYGADIYGADISDPDNPVEYSVMAFEDIDDRAPAIDGTLAVCQTRDSDTTPWSIYAADITDPANPAGFYVIYDPDHNQTNPAVSGNVVVWQDDFYGDWDIWAADVSDPNNPVYFAVCGALGDQTDPAIHGDIVVWKDSRYAGDADIRAADITNINNPVEFGAAPQPGSNQTAPDVYATTVAWADDRNTNSDIYAAYLETMANPVEGRVTTDTAEQTEPALYESTLVWTDARNTHKDIYLAVLAGCGGLGFYPADLNRDCAVNLVDFALLADQWLACTRPNDPACTTLPAP